MSSEPEGLKPIHFSRIKIIRNFIEEFDGSLPFHQYLQKHFTQNRKFGSGDRKLYRSWCYAWLRLGKALPELDFYQRLLVAHYLVHGISDALSIDLANSLSESTFLSSDSTSVDSRIVFIKEKYPNFDLNQIFQFHNELSSGLTGTEYSRSMLQQPKVFIRVAEGRETIVEQECNEKEIAFEKVAGLPGTFSFKPGVDLIKLVAFEKGYFEVQDLSSQLAGMAIPALPGEQWWDCCCGAGGKSIQLADKVKGVVITATDNRATIIKNFALRLKRFKNDPMTLKVLDLEKHIPDFYPDEFFDGIIADVPCSGSGTWSRTPEWLTIFEAADIQKFVSKQRAILTAIISKLKAGGTLVYITCSVFKEENEENVNWLISNSKLTVEKQEFISGVENLSDSMFYAVFKNNT